MPKKSYLEYLTESQSTTEEKVYKETLSPSTKEGSALRKLSVPSIHSSFEKSSESNTFDLEFKDGSSYSGQIIKHGFGTYKDSRGNIYEGNWNLDKKHGQGKQNFVSDSYYKQNTANESFSSVDDEFYKKGGKNFF